MNPTKVLTVAVCAALTTVLVANGSPAYADVWSSGQSKLSNAFVNAKNISFLIGGLGMIGLAVMAYFGRWQFKWFFALVGGLALIASAGNLIEYVTGSDTAEQVSVGVTDFGDTIAR